MNKNKENYKKAIDQIHVDENLKQKVLQNAKEKNAPRKSLYYLKYVVSFAAILVVAIVGVSIYNKPKKEILDLDRKSNTTEDKTEKKLSQSNIKRFKSIDELREKLAKYQENNNNYLSDIKGADMVLDSAKEESIETNTINDSDYSKTNNHVENVDEADLVKTDGKYIYYCQNSVIYICDKDLNLKSTIDDKSTFTPYQLFLNKDKLVVFGNLRNVELLRSEESNTIQSENITTLYKSKAAARIYDISNIENPELKREINVDGSYFDARMIENNIYFITTYNVNLYREIENLKDVDILPSYEDSIISDENQIIDATKIAYCDNNSDEAYSYSIIAGFSLDTDEDVNIETFLGVGNEIYVSENNIYIISPDYASDYWNIEKSIINRFQLNDGEVLASGSVNIEGYINDEFSLDEYEGNLRIATTVVSYNSAFNTLLGEDEEKYKNKILVFDENLEKIGEIENLIDDEEIYSVRFVGNIGYIVTFEEIDPLWVIDLSDPTNPIVKGQLEIPGYSSYLQPWDEDHIIGFGYNVEDNGYGGVTNDTIKVSMFDVSDLENPKELFNISFENDNAFSNIMYDHKSLFINKNENLIGFPIGGYNDIDECNYEGFVFYRIDMENDKFEEISDLIFKDCESIDRSIYIGDYIYCLSYNKIIKVDMNTFKEVKRLELN